MRPERPVEWRIREVPIRTKRLQLGQKSCQFRVFPTRPARSYLRKLYEQLADQLAVREKGGPAVGGVVGDGGGVVAEEAEDGGVEVGGGDGVFGGVGADFVGGADELAAGDAAAGEDDGVALGPVVAA